MANYCFNLITFYGTRQALREAMILLSQALPFYFEESSDGARCRPDYDTEHVLSGTRVPPLSRPEYLEPEAIMPVPLRYRGFGREGWCAPTFVERTGLALALRSAAIPEALIESSDDPVIELVLSCDSRDMPPLHVLQQLSRKLPRIVVQCQYEEHANDVFGAIAYHAGTVVASHDVERTVTRLSLGLPDDDDSDDAHAALQNAHQADGERQIAAQVTPLAQEAALTQLAQGPRWSGLTVASCDGGVEALSRCLLARPDFSEKLAALVQDLSCARRAATPTACWLDTCLYGNDALEELLRKALAAPGAEHQSNAWYRSFSVSAEKCLDLLAACAPNAQDRMFARAMVAVLSDPATRLMTGVHPVAILADACKDSRHCAAAEGLNRIITQMRAQLPKMPEAPLVGVEFLRHESGNRDGDLHNLVLGHILESKGARGMSALKLPKQLRQIPAERGPTLNPGYVFDPQSDALLRSLLHCGVQGGQAGLELALAAGFEETFLFRSLAFICPKEALESFVAVKGDVRLLSPEMATALEGACERTQDQEALAVYGALKSEAQMKGVIDGAVHVPVPAPRRRPRGSL